MLDQLKYAAQYMNASPQQRANMPKPFTSFFASPVYQTGAPPRLGTEEILAGYSSMPWLRAVTNKVGKSVGSANWKLMVPTNKQGRAIMNNEIQRLTGDARHKEIKRLHNDGMLREIRDHPMLSMLSAGNEQFPGMQVLQLTAMHYDLAGESYWILERNAFDTPIAMWNLPPHWVKQLPSVDRPTYIIGVGRHHNVEVPKRDIICFKEPDPWNPYGRGSGTGKALGDELQTDEYAANHTKAFFYNRARPDLLVYGDQLSPDDTKRLEESWMQKAQGVWKSWLPMFLNRDINVKELGQSFENMQMIQIRQHERDTIIQVYGAPPEKFGILNNSNRSTIVSADIFWNKDILMPRCETLRSVMQARLVPQFDERLVLDYDLPEIQDDEYDLRVMGKAPWAFNVDEWRAKVGSDPLGGEAGKQHPIPGKLGFANLRNRRNRPKPEQPNDNNDPNDNPTDQGQQENQLLDDATVQRIAQETERRVRKRLRK